MNGGTAMGQEASALKSHEEPILPTPSSATLGVTVVSPEPDTAAAVTGGVSSTENAPATVETLEEDFQNLGLEDKEEPILPIPPSSVTPGVTVVRPEPDTADAADTAAAAVPGGVSSTENATEETLEEELQNIGSEDNNKHNGDEDDDLKKDNLDNGDEDDDLKKDNLDNGDENDDLKNDYLEGRPRKILYPQRPDAADCAFYLRTGTCGYGSNCRFNHPFRKKNQVIKEKEKADLPEKTEQQESKEEGSTSPESAQVIIEKEKADLLEKMEQQECKYYLRSGGCKFGKACRYNHSREKYVRPPPPPLDFNFLGLPIRPGERECPYYMRTGSCKYGSNCRFHHPDPTAVGGADSTPGSVSLHPSGASQPSSTSWSSPSNEQVPFVDAATPYVPIMFPPQRLHPTPEWNGYQASACPPERSLLPPPLVAFNNPTNRTDIGLHNQQHMMDEFPERPGQPECSYFMKTGDCKYRSACKFHHPKRRIPSAGAPSAMGLPLRPVT